MGKGKIHKLMVRTGILYLLLSTGIWTGGCEMIDYHPYDVRISGPTDINRRNMARIEEACREKTTLRRFAVVEKNDDEFFGAYMHMGGKISVLAKLSGQEDASVAKNIAMQIASMSPAYITRDEIPADVVEHERGVQMNIMKEDPKMAGKSEEMLSKIIEGKISKHFKDQCLMDQEFFLNPDQKVSAFLKQSNASVSSFIRYAVGEGIEKKEENFVEEVMSQIKG